MKKKISATFLITTLICLSPLLATIFLYDKLPEQMVTNWDFNGQPGKTSSRAFAVIGFPLLMAAANALLYFALRTDPKNKNASRNLLAISSWILPVMSVAMYTLMVVSALQGPVNPAKYVFIGIGAMFVVIGNYLPKSRQSYTVGIKTPWALHDEENWNKTHRMAGPLWVAAGLVVIASGFTPFANVIAVTALCCATLIPFLYSYQLYRKTRD